MVEWNDGSDPTISGRRLVTADGWKLNLFHGDEPELYDLNNDPAELTNLGSDPAPAETDPDADRRVAGLATGPPRRIEAPDMMGLDGIIAVPATPFTDDDQVDRESLRRYARRVISQGAVGFVAPAVAGEADQLSEEEREQIVTVLVDEAGGRVPVIGGATDANPEARLRHARRFIELGCQGVLAYIRFDGDEASYAESVEALGALSPGFLMIQDLDRGRAPLPVSTIARLHREVPAFQWIKLETSDRCRKATSIREATGGSLAIATAGPDLIELLDREARAFAPTFAIGVYNRIWRYHRDERREEAIALYRRFLPCLTFMATHQAIQWRFTKALLKADGVFATTRIRTPAPELDAVEERLITEIAAYARDLSVEVAASES